MRVALVTGGATGIARCACLEFAKQGIAVVIANRDEAAGQATLEEVSGKCNWWLGRKPVSLLSRPLSDEAYLRFAHAAAFTKSFAEASSRGSAASPASPAEASADAPGAAPACTFCKTDISNEEDVKALMEHIRAT
jgi:NAD(P)-dependent dehydrogenase (short-subunit alcohol dehydrogenase family)